MNPKIFMKETNLEKVKNVVKYIICRLHCVRNNPFLNCTLARMSPLRGKSLLRNTIFIVTTALIAYEIRPKTGKVVYLEEKLWSKSISKKRLFTFETWRRTVSLSFQVHMTLSST